MCKDKAEVALSRVSSQVAYYNLPRGK
jgi:hypothetical protein